MLGVKVMKPPMSVLLMVALAMGSVIPVLSTVGGTPVARAEAAGTTTAALDGMSDRISAGSHVCVVSDEGQVMCWGPAAEGQLGYGNTTGIADTPGPAGNAVNGGMVPLPGGRTAVAVAAGNAHTCALLEDGQVSCWGYDAYGQLGYGNTNNIGDDETPAQNPVNGGLVPLPGGRTATSIAVMWRHTCAVLNDGQVACWGLGGSGQLGYGNTNDIGDDETPAQNPVNGGVVPLPAGRTAVAVSGTDVSTCALLDNGTVSCWGWGNSGRLGYGNTNDIGDDETPAQNPVNGGVVPLPAGGSAVAIAGGSHHMCAVLSNGQISCWGLGASGRLGYGNTNTIGDDETPAQNPVAVGYVPLPVGRTAVGVAADYQHTCALLDNGQLSCWGDGSKGRLGYGNTNSIGDDEYPSANPVNGGIVPQPPSRRVVAVTLGTEATCAILTDARVVCWGQTWSLPVNTRVGDVTTAASAVAIPMAVHRRVVSLGAGAVTTCALADDGVLTCWGSNAWGQLGSPGSVIGDNERANQAGGVPMPGERTVIAVSNAKVHSCAVLDNGQVACWGDGANGKLGYGNTTTIGDNETPAENPVNGGLVSLPAGRTAVAVGTGLTHTCALLDNGQVACWGDGANGKLGYGNTTTIGDNETPAQNPAHGGMVPLPGGASAVAISVGHSHACALLTSGSITCWGNNTWGQLGYGNTNDIGDNETPAQNPVHGGLTYLPAGRTAVAVAAGDFHTCALLDNGQVTCWGDGAFGKLGYGNTLQITNPSTNPYNGGIVPLPGGHTATAIAAGQDHTCAVLDNGQVSCWGDAVYGQLGYGNIIDIGDNETPAGNPYNGGIVALPAGRTAVAVATAVAHTCATLDDGTVSCWGYAGSGRLGYGNLNNIGDTETPAENPVNGGVVPSLQPLARTDYRAVQPARVLDTRGFGVTVDGQFQAGGYRAAGSTMAVRVAGRGGAPVDATAVTMTVTVVQPAAAGYLTVWPCAQPKPTASSLNFAAGANTANTVVMAAAGDICIFTSQATHLIADLMGFTPRTTRYVPVGPSRLLDTRPGFTTFDGQAAGGGQRAAGSSLTLQVTGRGAPIAVPTGIRTVLLNVAAVQPAASGYLTVWPCDRPQPNASNINFAAGVATANLVVADLSASGSVCIFTSQATQLIADVVGYFDSSATRAPTAVHTVNPGRLMDTRAIGVTADGRYQATGALTANTTYTVQIGGRFPLSAGRVAILNVAVVSPAGGGYLTVWPCDQVLPTASSLNYQSGVNRANSVITSLSATGTVCVRSSQPLHLIIDVSGSAR